MARKKKVKKKVEKESEEKISFALKKTRKAFLLEYGCGFFLLILLSLFYYQGIELGGWATYFIGGLGLASIGSAELSRWMVRYYITESKITIIEGLVKQHKKHINLYAIGFLPDINVRQGRIQRILNYGTIYVESSGREAFKIQDITCPHKMMEEIEGLMEGSRKAVHRSQR